MLVPHTDFFMIIGSGKFNFILNAAVLRFIFRLAVNEPKQVVEQFGICTEQVSTS